MKRLPSISVADVLVPVLAVGTAMLAGMVLLIVSGFNPFQAYGALLTGAVGSPSAIARTIIQATPMVLAGLSVMVAFRAGLFNIGATGQLIAGLICGGWVAIALEFPEWMNTTGLVIPGFISISWSQFIHPPLVLCAAALAGAAWGALAGFLKAVRGAHEVITTIMLNYIAIKIGEFLLRPGGALAEPGNPNPTSSAFEQSSGFIILWAPDSFTMVHFGTVIAILAAVAIAFLISRTSLGYQIRAVGLNPDAAEYGGINVAKITVVSMGIAGALAGLAGASIAVGDPPALLSKSDFSAIQVGFTGIAVALLGRNTALGVVCAALLFGALEAGAVQAQFDGGLPPGVGTKLIGVIQGLIILFVGADALFRKFANRAASSLSGGTPSQGSAPPPPQPPVTRAEEGAAV